MNIEKERYTYHFFIAAAFIIAVYIMVYAALDQGIFSHSEYDSYTRQAAAWWQGSANLPGNVTWLELSKYANKYFVSFPPFPSVAQFLLYPIFGMNTPDNLVNTLFGLGAFVLVYRFLMRRGLGGFSASIFALLMTIGSNLFYLSVTGWVWFSAQTQSYFFSILAVYLIYSEKKVSWYFSFLSLGIAFACRPFQAVYAPLLLYLLYIKLDKGQGVLRTLAGSIKYMLPLVFVGICVGAYNYARFDNIFEFGHDYLHEFEQAKQFSLSNVPGNFLQILKLPKIQGGSLIWPKYNGTLFFFVNPVFILLAVSLFKRFGKKQVVYISCFIVHFLLLLTHRTMGGWQFGCRYMVDMIPFMLVIFESNDSYKTYRATKAAILPLVLAVIGIAINIYGAVWYYTLPMYNGW